MANRIVIIILVILLVLSIFINIRLIYNTPTSEEDCITPYACSQAMVDVMVEDYTPQQFEAVYDLCTNNVGISYIDAE